MIINEHVVGPYFFERNVNADTYLDMLQNFVLPELERLGYDVWNVWFMQDGAPAHSTIRVREFLDQHFHAWIGRGVNAPIRWPPRSPDLNPLDFFVWGYLKNIVYLNRAQDINELRNKIEEALDTITVDMLGNTHAELRRRLLHCINVGGCHFEHL